MSPLCNSSNYQKYKRKSKRPSPTKFRTFHPALDENALLSKITRYIKEISLFASSMKLQASMTVEATVVLPIMLFFILNLSSIIEMIRFHGNMELALTMVGNTVCVYKGLASAPPEGLPEELLDTVFSQIYIQNRIEDYLGKEYVERSPLVQEEKGTYIGWNLRNHRDQITIGFSYKVACPFPVPGFQEFYMQNQFCGHIWTGYTIPGTDTGEGLDTIFLTNNAEVYHCKQECTHLQLKVSRMTLEEALQSRNEDGRKYVLCGRCGQKDYGGQVYVTKYGDNYHYQAECPGLKRTVYSATRAEAEGLGIKACSRCGGEE